MSYLAYLIISLIVYAIYYAINIAMDSSGKQTKGRQGEISLAGIAEQESVPVHSSALMEEFRKSAAFTKPASTGTVYEFDNGDEEEDGVQPLSDEDVTRQ